MKKFMIVLISLGLCLISQASWAEKAYVTNTSKIALRKGPGVEHEIVTLLRLDHPVELLGSKAGWSKVRLLGPEDDNLEGWVLSRFLTTQVPWETQVRSLEKENRLLKERLSHLEKDWGEVSSKEKGLTLRLKENTEALENLRKEHNALKVESADFLKLRKKYEVVRVALKEAQETAKRLTEENEGLRSSQRNRWFATGASVLFVGLIFGLIMGRQQRRRRSSYY